MKHGVEVDLKKVLPMLQALQGSPGSGGLWEEHCNQMLVSGPLDFQTTTHDRTICCTICNGEKTHMLRQVDDFSMACNHESAAEEMHKITGSKL